MMRLTLLQGAATEPLTLDDVKAHLRLDGEDEDALLGSLITTSRSHIEVALGMALNTQKWRWQADCWPKSGIVELITRPLQSVERIAVRDNSGADTVIAASDYVVDTSGQQGRIARRSGRWPAPGAKLAGIEIDFWAGYGSDASDVPEAIRQALKLLVAHWYEVRNPVLIGSLATHVPDTVSELLRPYKVHRI